APSTCPPWPASSRRSPSRRCRSRTPSIAIWRATRRSSSPGGRADASDAHAAQARSHPRDPSGVARPRGGRADAVPGLPAWPAPGGAPGPRGQSGPPPAQGCGLPLREDARRIRLPAPPRAQPPGRAPLPRRPLHHPRALVLIGPAGLGKTHLAISIGLALLKRGYLVRFTTTHALLTRVLRAGGLDGRAKVLRPYIQSDLLVLDEFGYLPADPEIGPILY